MIKYRGYNERRMFVVISRDGNRIGEEQLRKVVYYPIGSDFSDRKPRIKYKGKFYKLYRLTHYWNKHAGRGYVDWGIFPWGKPDGFK